MKRIICLILILLLLPLYALAGEGNWLVSNPESTWVNLREQSTTKSRSLGKYENGTSIAILDETDNGWYHVSVDGKTGYMLKGMVARVYTLADDTRIVGRTSDGQYIQCCTAPNGDALYFTTLEKTPRIKMEDVNFDGVADIVVFTVLGASNHFCEFFVYDNGHYRMAEHPGIDYGLCNYGLVPEKKLVCSDANNGYAGALHEDCIFRWEGTKLKLIRRAVSDQLTETEWQQDSWATTTYNDKLSVTIRDYTQGEYEGAVIWEEILDLYNDDVSAFMERERKALWNGL